MDAKFGGNTSGNFFLSFAFLRFYSANDPEPTTVNSTVMLAHSSSKQKKESNTGARSIRDAEIRQGRALAVVNKKTLSHCAGNLKIHINQLFTSVPRNPNPHY